MAAFHDVNGVPMSANRAMLNDVLRNEWGFAGFVVSDWTSISELVHHGVAGDAGDAAVLALHAGMDMDMVSDAYIHNLANRLKLGQVTQLEIDEAVRRILRIKHLAGLFENPYTDTSRATKVIRTAESLDFARKFAAQTIVLLKNHNDILPLGKNYKNIAVVGPMINAREDLFGTWTPDGQAEDATSIAEAIRQTAPEGIEFGFSDNVDEAMRMVQHSDATVVVLGEHPWRSGENSNVSSLELPPGQRQFLEVVANQGKPVVLVILAGRPLAITHELRLADAVLYAWHPGSEGGYAIADLLFGLAVPGAKLPITMPRATGQVPIYYAHKNSGRPGGVKPFLTRYVDLPYGPLFPFGFGLSYTRFNYSNLNISALRFKSGKNHISADVTNTGTLAGTEIAQLYLRDLIGTVTRPVKQLKGFKKLHLKAGETQKVEFELLPEDLAFTGMYDKPVIEPGDFKVWVGPNSAEGLQGEFTLY
jgi:beta-glucosidase